MELIAWQPEIWEQMVRFLPMESLYVLECSSSSIRSTFRDDALWTANLRVLLQTAIAAEFAKGKANVYFLSRRM